VTARPRRATRRAPRIAEASLVFAVLCVPPLPVQVAWLADPALRDEPLAVVGESERVRAACPAAFAAGVRAGHRLSQARLLCPAVRTAALDTVAAAVLYEDLLAALASLSPLVEAADPDTAIAYLDGRGLERLIGDVTAIARAARNAAVEVGLTVSAGAGPTRLLARLVTERVPEAGFLATGQAWQLLHALPLADDLFALPPQILHEFDDLGVRTAGALAGLPRAALVLRFDAAVVALWDVVSGAPEPPLRPWSPPVVCTVRHASDDGIDDRLVLEAILMKCVGALLGQLHALGEATAQLTLRIRRANGTLATARTWHWPPLCAGVPLERAALALLGRILAQPTAEPVSLLRLDAGALGPNQGLQSPLFGDPLAARLHRLTAVLADQAGRHGAAVLGRWRADALAPDGWTHEDGLA
jgi:nucleotidyltransferase/DNA polymerase involved in DNA repair